MKVIAVFREIPIVASPKGKRSCVVNSAIENMLLDTPLENRASTLRSVMSKSDVGDDEDCPLEITHRPLHQSLIRDLHEVILLGMIPKLCNRRGRCNRDSLVSSLRRNYMRNKFYPVTEENLEDDAYRKFSDVRLKNTCFSTQWNDIVMAFDEEKAFESYRKLNRVFFDEIAKIYEEGDVIWILDHSLWLLPRTLREKIPGAKIGVTVFLPFPSSDLFSCISFSSDIIDSLLSSSYIEFQSRTSLRNFLGFCKVKYSKVLCDNRTSSIRLGNATIKYSVNRYKVETAVPKSILSTRKCREYVKKLKEKYKGRKVVVSVTSISDSHTLLNVYKAIEHFLDKYGTRNIVFINIEVLDGVYDPEIKSEIGRIEEYIRMKYGENLFRRRVGMEDYKYYGLLSIVDCGMVLVESCEVSLPMIDIILSHADGKNFPLLVSKNSRFSKKIGLTMVNPRDFSEVARKVKKSLEMPESRMMDLSRAKEVVSNRCKNRWFKKFLRNMTHVDAKSRRFPDECTSIILEKYKEATKRAFLLDYDGSLTKIVKNPKDANPSDSLIQLLESLSEKNKVIIVTGRDRQTIGEWITNPGIEIYAEHGTLHREHGTWESICRDMSWMTPARDLINFYVERTPGSFLEIKETALCFHYRQCSKFIQKKQADSCKASLQLLFRDFKNLEINEGKCVIEIRDSDRNKGTVVKNLDEDYDFVLCAGDDLTDESMFSACKNMNNFYSVLIGKRESNAKFSVSDPELFINMLEKLSNY